MYTELAKVLNNSMSQETGLSSSSRVTDRTSVAALSEDGSSSAETVEGASLALESVDDVEGSHGLSAGVFGVGDRVPDDVLEEATEDGAGLLIDVRGDTLDATTASESADSGLGDAHDGGAHSLLLSLGSVLASLGLSVAANLCFAWHELIVFDYLN